jgi:hypothetical protein
MAGYWEIVACLGSPSDATQSNLRHRQRATLLVCQEDPLVTLGSIVKQYLEILRSNSCMLLQGNG